MGTFRIPVQCQQKIRELASVNLCECRDVTGKIDTEKLKVLVGASLRARYPDDAKLVQQHGYSVSIAQTVEEYIRSSKEAYPIHHREQEVFEQAQRVRARQRRIVSYTDAAGLIVHKERRFLSKAELLKVVAHYEAIRQGAQDVIDWCQAAWEQMDLMGLGDEAIVGDVLGVEEEEDATGTEG